MNLIAFILCSMAPLPLALAKRHYNISLNPSVTPEQLAKLLKPVTDSGGRLHHVLWNLQSVSLEVPDEFDIQPIKEQNEHVVRDVEEDFEVWIAYEEFIKNRQLASMEKQEMGEDSSGDTSEDSAGEDGDGTDEKDADEREKEVPGSGNDDNDDGQDDESDNTDEDDQFDDDDTKEDA